MPQEYAIVDIETTGRSVQKVTEIAIIIHDGQKVIDQYQSLVNPESSIPFNITQLTGINDEMVMHAPKFYEIARQVFEMTEGRIFVAHNVGFDHGVLKAEFESLGGTFEREQLCTVRLSKKLLPGHRSYSLGKLCGELGIPINGRHRAFGDAEATTKLMDILLAKADSLGMDQLNLESLANVPNIPPQLDIQVYKTLPTQTGIYYFYNERGEVIYIGKAKNIKERIRSHFGDKSKKEKTICSNIHDIKYEITGSELIALLLESEMVKKYQPEYNRNLKQKKPSHGLYAFENGQGILNLSIGKNTKGSFPITTFKSQGLATQFIENLVEKYRLCPRYTGLEKTNGKCFASLIKKCDGVCCDKESPEDYNARVEAMLSDIVVGSSSFIIEEDGRSTEEIGIIQIQMGRYMGYGFVPKEAQHVDQQGYVDFITPKMDDPDSISIIQQYLRKI